jgi:protein NRD1
MVLEEPDIEIGAGVSSKGRLSLFASQASTNIRTAISRRVATDAPRGGARGGFNGGGGRGTFDHGPKYRKVDNRPPPPAHDPRHISPRPEPMIAVPPAVPGFGFQLPGF